MAGPGILVLDDGELEDVQAMLEEIGAPFTRLRGGAIGRVSEAPTDLLVSTPRRTQSIEPTSHDVKGPVRIVVSGEDSNALREQLRGSGFDYLVRRPVHPEALKLLLLRCLYKGDERRHSERVAVGTEVSFRSGLLLKRATLIDLSLDGCRLMSQTPVDEGKRVRLQIPDALDPTDPVVVNGLVTRSRLEQSAEEQPFYHLGLQFERVSEDSQDALRALIEARAGGPATLETSVAREAGEGAAPEIQVDMRMQPESGAEESAALAANASRERRGGSRVDYAHSVPAFGKRALRVLVGRDLSVGGMRIEALPGLELRDRLHLAIYGNPGEAPFLIWATVTRDDGAGGMGLVFDPVESKIAARLESLVGDLPSVEDLRDDEVDALGTVVSEILER